MDNKKWYKRLSTCFWFLLATLPIWVGLIRFIFMWFIHTDSLSDIQDIQTIINLNTISNAFDSSKNYFMGGSPSFIRSMYEQLLITLGFSVYSSLPSFLVCFMSWFTWVYFIELMVDFIVWLPKWCHNMLSKGVDKID